MENSDDDGVLYRETTQAATDTFDSDDDNNGENEDDVVGNAQSIAGDIGLAPDDDPNRNFDDSSDSADEDSTGYYRDGNPYNESRRSCSPPPRFDPDRPTNYDDEVIVEEYAMDGNPIATSGITTVTITSSTPSNGLLPYYEQMVENNADHFGTSLFSNNDRAHAKLISILDRNGAHLSAFHDVMKWAQEATMRKFPFLANPPHRGTVITNFTKRACTSGLEPVISHLKLPVSGKVARIVYFDAKAVIASLLTSAQLHKDENYLFHNDDPFAPPPATPDREIGDINTGRCYAASYKSFCTEPGDVLLLTPLALDKTHVDTLGRIKLEPLNLSLGIHKRSIRQLSKANRPLGYVSMYFPGDCATSDPDVAADVEQYTELDSHGLSKAAGDLNDYHAQLRFILDKSGFTELQRTGFKWKLQYKGETHEVTFRLVVPFIVGDTEGHDRLCGHYLARFAKVAQLCRICECPTHLTDYSKASFPYRLPARINKLVATGRLDHLKLMSQQILHNAFQHVVFGSHNKRGIFGACLGEILHMIELGEYKVVIEAFFEQVGLKSQACLELEQLIQTICSLLSHQSDREVPRTNFPDGFSTCSNLRGHEVGGCLLVLLFALSTERFGSIFAKRKVYSVPGGLGDEEHVHDWCLLIIALLSWEQWLKQETIPRFEVLRSGRALRWLMRHMQNTAPRNVGMGYKRPKHHLLTHIQNDILDFGVPQCYNSAYNERNHIEIVKTNFNNTQKRKSSVTEQTARRYVEKLTIAQVMERTENRDAVLTEDAVAIKGPIDTGTWFFLQIHAALVDSPSVICKKGSEFRMSTRVLKFIASNCPPNRVDNMIHCFTEHKRHGEIFRGHPGFAAEKKPWNDCVLIDWGIKVGRHPALIKCFVDVHETATGTFHFLGETFIEGTFAVCECFTFVDATFDDPEADWDIVLKGEKEMDNETGLPLLRIVSVDSFFSPMIGLPDVDEDGHVDRNRFMFMRRREQWSRVWSKYIRDIAASQEPESEEEGDLGDVDDDDDDSDINDVNDVEADQEDRKRARRSSSSYR